MRSRSAGNAGGGPLGRHARDDRGASSQKAAEGRADEPRQSLGVMMTRGRCASAKTCDRLGIAFISGEIHHRAQPQDAGRDGAALRLPTPSSSIRFSKCYCMTGWRIGWLVAAGKSRRTVRAVQQKCSVCPFL